MLKSKYNRRAHLLQRSHIVAEWLPISVATIAGVVIVLLLALIAINIA